MITKGNIKKEAKPTKAKSGDGTATTFFTPMLQKKLAIGTSDDPLEVEADQIGDQVIAMADSAPINPPTNNSHTNIQRKCSHCDEEEHIQRKALSNAITPRMQRATSRSSAGRKAAPEITSKIQNSRGSGSLMDTSTKGYMENRFGVDFSGVRIHRNSTANQLSKTLGAQAFTVGNDIYFNEGKYNPSTQEGKHLLAHELTHTLQQKGEVRRKISKPSIKSVPKESAISNNRSIRSLPGGATTRSFNHNIINAELPNLGAGHEIPKLARTPFENSYGFDLAPVRLHRGYLANKSLRMLNTVAFTINDHIVMDSSIDLSSTSGMRILGHELSHVVQGRISSENGNHQPQKSQTNWRSEIEAEKASIAACNGNPYTICESVRNDIHQVAPWLILAGIGLAAGLVTWATSDSPEENRARHAAGEEDSSRSLWALVPIYGSIQQIREAESYFQRVLGVGFLMLDFATLGSAGVAARALIRAPAALVRTAVQKQGGRLVVQEGGEIVTETVARETAEAFSREGGAILASRAVAQTEMLEALTRGAVLLVTEGGINHAVLYAKNAAGQLIRVHGGPLKLLFETGSRELTEQTVGSIARRTNAYVIIEGAEATYDLERAASIVNSGSPAIVRWLSGNPTSCGIVQGALLEAAGLSTEAMARLMPSASSAANRLVPITILDHIAQSGTSLRLVDGGMARIIGGTVVQESMLLAGGTIPTILSTIMRLFVTSDNSRRTTGNSRLNTEGTAIEGPAVVEPIPAEPVPEDQITTTATVFVEVLSDAYRQGYNRVVLTVRRSAREISPGFRKLEQGQTRSGTSDSMSAIIGVLVRQIANSEVGEYCIIATSSSGNWGLELNTDEACQ